MTYSMKIFDIFHLAMGGTTLAGKLSEQISIITTKNKYIADLIVDGSIYQQNIHIIGEWMGCRTPDGYRAISTPEIINLDYDFIKSHDCQLLLFKESTPNL